MNVNLTPELEDLVRRKVESGLYNNQSEVVREALRLLAEHDRLREAHIEGLKSALAQGIAEAEAGKLKDGAVAIEELRAGLSRRRKPGS